MLDAIDEPVLKASLVKDQKIELAVNERGNALLLHQGPVKESYLWIQFDSYTGTVQLITEAGAIHELGFKIPAVLKNSLRRAKQISMIEITGDNQCRAHTLLSYNTVLE